LPKCQINIIPNIIQYAEKQKTEKSKTIFYGGGLSKYKGIDYILKGLNDIRELKILISGSGSTEQWESLKREFNLNDNFNFLGKLDYCAVNSLLKDSTLTVSPSLWPEPFSRIVHESFSHGTPVIATDVGGQSEAIKKSEGGILTDPNSPSTLAENVVKLLKDPAKLKEMSANAHSYVRENMNSELIAKEHLSFYKKCLH